MNTLMLKKQLVMAPGAGTYVLARNKSGGSVAAGNTVILSTAYTTSTEVAFITTTAANNKLVLGMALEAIGNGAVGKIQLSGVTAKLMVNGTTDIVAGDYLATYTSAGIAAKATAGKGGVFAIALEAYATNDSLGVIDAWLMGNSPRIDVDATGVTMDDAYDGGIAVTVDAGAVALTNAAADNNGVLALSKSPVGAQSGAALAITLSATATGAGISFANSGGGADLLGSGSTWSVSKAGAVVLTTLSSTAHSLLEGTAPAATVCYIVRDNTGDVTINALTGKEVDIAVAGVNVVAVAGAGVTVTGNLTITGNIDIGGNLNYGAALTVDELILDADGVAPAGTVCYLVQDNTGDVTVNALTGKTFNVAVNGTDEYTFSGTILDFNANAADNVGFLILNAATAPAGTEVYAVNDNTGDLTLNALTGKKVHIAIAGTDEFNFSGTAFEVAAANNIQFLGDNGVLDSAGNEVVLVEAVGSAVNYLLVKNAATANPIILSCEGTADRGFKFENDQDEEILILTPTASAVNEITIVSAATGNKPTIMASGEGDLGMILANYDGANVEEILILTATATAVNEITITSTATTVPPSIKATGETNIGLNIDTNGTGNLTLMLGGDEVIRINDAGITFAAAADTAGHAVYLQTEDGGADGGAGTGRAGAAMEVRTGDGSASATAAQVGGAGGAMTLVSGAGLTGNTTGNGGVGGAIAVTAGAGGDSGAGAGVGGTGGSIVLTAGAGGGAGGGVAGAPGSVQIAAGTFKLVVQTIDMADATVTLTLVPGTPTGTLLTGNILYVDPNSGQASEDLLLPPEGDCTGLLLVVANTGGESIVVKNDFNDVLYTLETLNTAYMVCDGTTWRGTVGVP
uniref:Uncharacterized protein n=1 Tax=viral metagenome TaxID=1070528 RepID=A0A6M3K1M8_9ZZZZ